MRLLILLSCLLGWLLLDGCNREYVLPTNPDLLGTWQLYEEGGSTGFSYYIIPVAASPRQSLTFTKGGTVQPQGNQLAGFATYPYYRYDILGSGSRLLFLKNRTDTTGLTVGWQLKADSLRLIPTCYEGCHFGFVRVR